MTKTTRRTNRVPEELGYSLIHELQFTRNYVEALKIAEDLVKQLRIVVNEKN